MIKIFDRTTDALGASINFRSLRHNVTSANIANAETPGYKAKVMDFEDALARAVDLDGATAQTTTSPDHFCDWSRRVCRALGRTSMTIQKVM